MALSLSTKNLSFKKKNALCFAFAFEHHPLIFLRKNNTEKLRLLGNYLPVSEALLYLTQT